MSALRSADQSPRAYALPRLIWQEAVFQAGQLLRHGEQLLLTFVIPLLALFGLGWSEMFAFEPPRTQHVYLVVVSVAAMATAFTGLAITTAYERRDGALRYAATSPLGVAGLFLGKILATLMLVFVQLVVFTAATGLLPGGWSALWSGTGHWSLWQLLSMLLTLILTVAAWGSWSLLLAGTVRAEGVLGLANLIFILMISLGNVLIPFPDAPSWLSTGLAALPGNLSVQALNDSWAGLINMAALGGLALWAVVGALLARKFFSLRD